MFHMTVQSDDTEWPTLQRQKKMNAESSPCDNFENRSIQKSEKRLIMQQYTSVQVYTAVHLYTGVHLRGTFVCLNTPQSLTAEYQQMHKY